MIEQADRNQAIAELREIADRIERGENLHVVFSSVAVSETGVPSQKSHIHGRSEYVEYLLFNLMKHHLFNEFRTNLTITYPKAN